MAAQAGWWEHQQDAPGWERGHSASRETCRAVEIIAGNKPVSFLTLIKQLKGGHAPSYASPGAEKALPGRRGDGISVGAAGVARGARPRPSPRSGIHRPCCSSPAGPTGSAEQRAGMAMTGCHSRVTSVGGLSGDTGGGDSARPAPGNRGCGTERDVPNRSAWKPSRLYIC